jgi:hypothetical protein
MVPSGTQADAAAAEVAVQRRDPLPGDVIAGGAGGPVEQAGVAGEGVVAIGIAHGRRAGRRQRIGGVGAERVAARAEQQIELVGEFDVVLHEHRGIPHARVAGLGRRVDRIDRREKRQAVGPGRARQVGVGKRLRLVEHLGGIRDVEIVQVLVGIVFETPRGFQRTAAPAMIDCGSGALGSCRCASVRFSKVFCVTNSR